MPPAPPRRCARCRGLFTGRTCPRCGNGRAWQGSNRRAELPKEWAHIRRRVLERDSYLCTECGAPATDVHHIDGRDDHDIAHLASLCSDCHASHTGRDAARARRDR